MSDIPPAPTVTSIPPPSESLRITAPGLAPIMALAAERDALAAKLAKITRHARRAGKARWKGTTKAQRSAAMRKAVLARWSKRKPLA